MSLPLSFMPRMRICPVSTNRPRKSCSGSMAWARLPEARGNRGDRAVQRSGRNLELVTLRNRSLMDVPGEDQLCARVDERGEHVRSPRDRFLARAPRRDDATRRPNQISAPALDHSS